VEAVTALEALDTADDFENENSSNDRERNENAQAGFQGIFHRVNLGTVLVSARG
jgi:hypothetical protein